MEEPNWREDPHDPGYRWAVTKWKLLADCPAGEVDVEDEYGLEMGSPALVRAAIDDAVTTSAVGDVSELIKQLHEDLKNLEEEEKNG